MNVAFTNTECQVCDKIPKVLGLPKYRSHHERVATGEFCHHHGSNQNWIFQHSDLREEIRLHSLHATKELVAQVEILKKFKLNKKIIQASNKEELEKALDEYLR